MAQCVRKEDGNHWLAVARGVTRFAEGVREWVQDAMGAVSVWRFWDQVRRAMVSGRLVWVATLGAATGITLGAALGATLGATVGTTLGSSVGTTLGTAVGPPLDRGQAWEARLAAPMGPG